MKSNRNSRNLPAHLRPKKKGHQPAHLNKNGAFKHNPKSKKTERILSLPNENVCTKCHEKIEWRKKYRKYKPLTQPTKCNLCQRPRSVFAAYHTICVSCTLSSKALNNVLKHKGEETARKEENETKEQDLDQEQKKRKQQRVCAICVKEYAIQDNNDDDEEDFSYTGKLSLRQKRTLERQKLKGKQQKGKEKRIDREEQEEEELQNVENKEITTDDETTHQEKRSSYIDDDDDDNDPFLQMVGGVDKLLVGEAYQQHLLQQQQQLQQHA